ncbi:Yfh7 [Kluyveromyces lactis]|nr:Yfh7 [Kluyveromyces lactis]
MLDYDALVDQALQLLEQNINKNYRVCIGIIGPPGSGKSTVAENLKERINSRYHDYLAREHHAEVTARPLSSAIDLTGDLSVADKELQAEIMAGFYSHVEDNNFKPVQVKESDWSTLIVGRGGLENAFRIKLLRKETNLSSTKPDIAQIVPMDGFHLSRKHLDHFKDPTVAHLRRGSPFTFDSNNFLQLCKVLSKTCSLDPNYHSNGPETVIEDNTNSLFDNVTNSFIDLPEISFPGFDHAMKDPVADQHTVHKFTRILILEGLYLLLNQENWSLIYDAIASTDAFIFWNIVIDEDVIEQRVAKRHVKSGICLSLEEGIQRFRANDQVNGRLIQSQSVKNANKNVKNVYDIRND